MEDELYLEVGGRAISGWTDIRVGRGIERCPSDFQIGLTEQFPGQIDAVVVQPGDTCVVKLAADIVLTGYVDRVHYGIAEGAHTVTVVGRGKCADLVDCAALWPGYQISGADALGVAQKLAAPYDITVSVSGNNKGARIEQFNLMHGETAWEVIERVCRWGALLAYDRPDGNLLLTNAGTDKAASGVRQGENVQGASMVYAHDQRYSEYRCFAQSVEVMNDVGEGGNLMATVYDSELRRFRVREIISEAPYLLQDFAIRRATWEMNRRAARSTVLQVTVDNWRDEAGLLWEPNTLVPVEMPLMKCGDIGAPAQMILASVNYLRDPSSGTTAQLMLMPPVAFNPIPAVQFNKLSDVAPQAGSPPELWGNEVRR
ncbi:phage baseplate assembly protein [uncultured Pseudacidovorax sp.]|uniref:phage baseplate assembly protein n=1 Tax=uncultured Pseudacidovorax sp. TaxID=679313 RepID=UPI0025E6711D|nr:Mu P family protein [uncultured Pseudacidovorax sp.]